MSFKLKPLLLTALISAVEVTPTRAMKVSGSQPALPVWNTKPNQRDIQPTPTETLKSQSLCAGTIDTLIAPTHSYVQTSLRSQAESNGQALRVRKVLSELGLQRSYEPYQEYGKVIWSNLHETSRRHIADYYTSTQASPSLSTQENLERITNPNALVKLVKNLEQNPHEKSNIPLQTILGLIGQVNPRQGKPPAVQAADEQNQRISPPHPGLHSTQEHLMNADSLQLALPFLNSNGSKNQGTSVNKTFFPLFYHGYAPNIEEYTNLVKSKQAEPIPFPIIQDPIYKAALQMHERTLRLAAEPTIPSSAMSNIISGGGIALGAIGGLVLVSDLASDFAKSKFTMASPEKVAALSLIVSGLGMAWMNQWAESHKDKTTNAKEQYDEFTKAFPGIPKLLPNQLPSDIDDVKLPNGFKLEVINGKRASTLTY